jgi:hypothetical protein
MFLLLQVRVQRYLRTHSVDTVNIAAIVGPDVDLSLVWVVGKRTLGSTTDVGFACWKFCVAGSSADI